MIGLIKKLFGKIEEKEFIPDPPGRTFKRVPTSKYFEGEYPPEELENIAKAKQNKIDQIKALELAPKFLRYTFKHNNNEEITAAYVVFQKEIFDEKWNMVHVTEVSFCVQSTDFEEFENMSGISLQNDFRDLSQINNKTYNGEERRREERELF
ncbi:hypothetical protein PGH07_05250 [Sulfurovum sp. zt1-1]|uniref:Uncharacterized protein n=1 Tax=Sulfurovum zhangzhouensis TaxID=3019067 RepID=A0ABT7QXR5_9BACT|nr:hypothetical protein [Sulfurovum zhangzhouensis]MDM5271573.1 hypothetical protein [Sulfurovum zhangzhouensis]